MSCDWSTVWLWCGYDHSFLLFCIAIAISSYFMTTTLWLFDSINDKTSLLFMHMKHFDWIKISPFIHPGYFLKILSFFQNKVKESLHGKSSSFFSHIAWTRVLPSTSTKYYIIPSIERYREDRFNIRRACTKYN